MVMSSVLWPSNSWTDFGSAPPTMRFVAKVRRGDAPAGVVLGHDGADDQLARLLVHVSEGQAGQLLPAEPRDDEAIPDVPPVRRPGLQEPTYLVVGQRATRLRIVVEQRPERVERVAADEAMLHSPAKYGRERADLHVDRPRRRPNVEPVLPVGQDVLGHDLGDPVGGESGQDVP
jgi:hypothetical protein